MSDIEQKQILIEHRICIAVRGPPRQDIVFSGHRVPGLLWHATCRFAALAAFARRLAQENLAMAGLLNDFRLALRSVRKAPAFAAAAIIVLEIGRAHV